METAQTAQISVTVDKNVVQKKVREMYAKVAQNPKGLSLHFEMGRGLAEKLGYPKADLDMIPQEALDSYAGVGYHIDFADLNEGSKVLDLGSGSGTDLFLAALKIGKTGKAIGLDMTDAQLQKAANLARKYRIANAELKKGYIEKLPFNGSTFDAVISNGVINLSTEKENVFREIFRVLKKGGRMAISDIISERQLSDRVVSDPTLWAECIGGAMQQDNYKSAIMSSGLKLKEIKDNPQYRFLNPDTQKGADKYGVKSASILAVKE